MTRLLYSTALHSMFHSFYVPQSQQCLAPVNELVALPLVVHTGFKLEPSEVARLVGLLESSGEEGEVGRATLLASQLDWRSLQRNHTEDWLGLARR